MPRRRTVPRSPQERRRLRQRFAVIGLVFGLAVVIYAFHAVPRLGVFHIRQLQIQGTDAVPDAEIREHVQAQLQGQTIYTVNRSAITKRLEQLPFVETARVTTSFPNGLRIAITEYQPLAVGLSGRTAWLVARDGRVLTQVRLTDWKGTVPVVDFDARSIRAGQNVGDEPALSLLRDTPPTYPYAFRSIELTSIGLQGTLQDGVRLRFGDEAQLPQKLAVAQRILGLYANGPKLQYVDVTVPARPAAKPR